MSSDRGLRYVLGVTIDTAVFFGASTSPARPGQPLSPKVWTCVGGLAIPLWATWPALSLQMRGVPAFESLAIAFFVGSIVLSRIEKRSVTADSVPAAWLSWISPLAFAIGLSGSSASFIFATHHIPAAEANLISYLWPGMIVGIGATLRIFRLRWRQFLGITLGFLGAAILMGGGALSLSYAGIGLALLSAVSWALYCVFRLKWSTAAGPLLARGCAISAVLCGILHFAAEPWVVPSLHSAAAATVIGILPTAFANYAWDEGFRRGDSQLLAVMAYATPLCSTLFLIALGLESFTWKLLIGAIVIVVAGMLSRATPS